MANIIKKLKNDAWAIMSKDDKLSILSDLEKDVAKKLGRKAREIITGDLPGVLGLYDAAKDKLIISENSMQSAGIAICTTYHEGRHAYQHDVITNRIDNNNKIVWSKNWNGYLNPNAIGIQQMDYYMQPIERDAWEWGIKHLEKIARKSKDIHILNDLTDFKLILKGNKIKMQRSYGGKAEQIIQAKIDAVFSQGSNSNNYFNVVNQLSKEGLHNERMVDYIIPRAQVEKAVKMQEESVVAIQKKVAKDKAEKRKAIADKYGFSDAAVEDATKRIEQGIKTQKENPAAAITKSVKKTDEAKETIVKVSVKNQK